VELRSAQWYAGENGNAYIHRARMRAACRGWERLYVDDVLQADTGADLDFRVGSSESAISRESH
jgi:hypothetical protein